MNIEPKYSQNLSGVVVPRWLYDQMAMYNMATEGLIPVSVPRTRDQINPANLNYPWKGHPIR